MLTDMAVALTLFMMMWVNYCLNTVSIRMVARSSYVGVALTDGLIASFGFWMIQEIVHAQTWQAFVGYVSGGVIGSLTGLWITRRKEQA